MKINFSPIIIEISFSEIAEILFWNLAKFLKTFGIYKVKKEFLKCTSNQQIFFHKDALKFGILLQLTVFFQFWNFIR